MKCQSCHQFPPIVECRECSKRLCYPCDDSTHTSLAMSRHSRSTIAFRDTHNNLSRSMITLPTEPEITKISFLSPKSFLQPTQQSRRYDKPLYQSYSRLDTQSRIIEQSNSRIIETTQKEQPSSIPIKSRQVTQPQELPRYTPPANDKAECDAVREQIRQEEEQYQRDRKAIEQEMNTLALQCEAEEKELTAMQGLLKEYADRFHQGEEQIEIRIKEIEALKDQYNNQLQDHKRQLTTIRERYEIQILELEERLIKASERIDQIVEADVDDVYDEDEAEEQDQSLTKDLTDLERQMKATALEAGQQSDQLVEQGQRYDDLSEKVRMTMELQKKQLAKMDEIINIFKMCSEEMQKEKQLLLLDNEKLIAEVEIFGKFFDENAGLLERVAMMPGQQAE